MGYMKSKGFIQGVCVAQFDDNGRFKGFFVNNIPVKSDLVGLECPTELDGKMVNCERYNNVWFIFSVES